MTSNATGSLGVTDQPDRPGARVRVVAIGASAGGLEPIESFFDALPDPSGVAFVIVQHLSPDFRSMMPELLKRHSSMPIKVIEDGAPLEPDVIFLNPPRTTLRLENEVFRLSETEKVYEFTLPINDFFDSLAKERGDSAIGIVMSGTGSDGTVGSMAIASAGGVVLVQDPAASKFESMPRSVLNAVPEAVHASPRLLARTVLNLLAGKEIKSLSAGVRFKPSTPEEVIFEALQTRFGIDFGYYKTSTVGRRIARRAQMKGAESVADYAETLDRDAEELEALYADLLIGVTSFFRDRQAFEVLTATAIARLGALMASGQEARVWVPGCASGEEAYTIAILLAERARLLGVKVRAKIFATDIHPRSLRLASRGLYPRDRMESVPEEIRARYFTESGENYQLSPSVREFVVFSKHNLIRDPPFTRMDLVSCRNLLIYFDDEAQRKCIALFHFALRKGGALFLGPSETLGALTGEFDVIDGRWRIFTKRRDVRLAEATRLLPITSRDIRDTEKERVIQPTAMQPPIVENRMAGRHSLLRVYDAVLGQTIGSALLINRQGEIVHVFADAGKFMQFASGQFTKQVADLVRPELSAAISAGVEWCRKNEDEFARSVYLQNEDAIDEEIVTVRMRSVDTGGPVEHAPLLVSFRTAEPTEGQSGDVEGPLRNDDALGRRVEELERSLRFSEENLRTTTEELETSNEELQAANEELQATNEELMASNEELQTVNEELHAVNEELYTVSAEHKTKIEELTTTTADLDALLESTNIGVLFLDSQLRIRRTTPAVAETFNILLRDVGRPIAHVTSRFEFPDLQDAVSEVLETGETRSRTIGVDGRDYMLRILPYRSGETISGAVLTFVDVTDMARANRSLTQFADIVSHDLKAPLRGIRAASDWIVEDLGETASDEVKGHAARLAELTERLANMLVELRDFSNLTRQPQKFELVDLSGLVSEIASLFDTGLIEVVEQTPLPEIPAARAALRLVFQNLMDNAVKHSGVKPVRIEISAVRGDAAWVFAIADNGSGVDPRHHDKIFLPFRKLRPHSESPGSGIGLALVRKTIEEQGGAIEIRSDPSVAPGATFLVTWPDAPDGAETTEAAD